MPRYRFIGKYDGAITGTFAGHGPEKIDAWVAAQAFDGVNAEGVFTPVDVPACRLRVTLPAPVVDDPAHWDGVHFSAPSSVFEITVKAGSASACDAVLAKNVFSPHGGRSRCVTVHVVDDRHETLSYNVPADVGAKPENWSELPHDD